MALDNLPTSATWWHTMTGDGKAVWNRSDKTEHVGYVRKYDEDYEGGDKFSVFRGDGLQSGCECREKESYHLIFPDQFIGHAATEYEAAKMAQDYCEDAADNVTWRGTPPIQRRCAKHPRAQKMWI